MAGTSDLMEIVTADKEDIAEIENTSDSSLNPLHIDHVSPKTLDLT